MKLQIQLIFKIVPLSFQFFPFYSDICTLCLLHIFSMVPLPLLIPECCLGILIPFLLACHYPYHMTLVSYLFSMYKYTVSMYVLCQPWSSYWGQLTSYYNFPNVTPYTTAFSLFSFSAFHILLFNSIFTDTSFVCLSKFFIFHLPNSYSFDCLSLSLNFPLPSTQHAVLYCAKHVLPGIIVQSLLVPSILLLHNKPYVINFSWDFLMCLASLILALADKTTQLLCALRSPPASIPCYYLIDRHQTKNTRACWLSFDIVIKYF